MGCAGSKEGTGPLPVTLFLPQQRTLEQQRADQAAIDEIRSQYEWAYDEPAPLPPKVKKTPLSYVSNIAPHMKDFITIFMRIQVSKVFEWTNLLNDWIKGHPEAGPFDKFKAMYTPLAFFPPPSIMYDWETDDAFVRARTNGLYPWFLSRAVLKDHDFPVTDALLGDLIKGHTLAELEAAGRLFIISLPELEGVEAREGAVIAAPIELHWVNDAGDLKPLAIQLRQKSADSPVFTPNDPPNLWLAVKMHASTAVTTMHTFFIHATEMHWVSETCWLACIRNVAPDHPLRLFLEPHYHVIFFVNSSFRAMFNAKKSGVAGAVTMLPAFVYMQTTAPKGHWEVQRNGFKTWTFDRLNIPESYKKRGLENLRNKTYYRDDSLLIWNTHSKLCRGVIEAFYSSDKDVEEDYQLQAWLAELASPLGGALSGLPTNAEGKIVTREKLVEFVSCLFFDCTLKHSFLEAAKLDYFGFVPFNPDTFRLPIPQTKDEITIQSIVDALPSNEESIHQGALMHNGGTAPDDFKLELLPKEYLKGAPAAALNAVETWKEDLKVAEATIKARNEREGVNYTYCLPSVSANQIQN